MTFEVGEVINYIIDSFLSAPIVNSIAKNPIYTALVVTVVIMIIIMIVFRDIDADETLFTMTLRSGFWVFVMMLGILMIHNRVLGAEIQAKTKDGNYDKIFVPSAAGRLDGEFVPVNLQNRMQGSGYGSSSSASGGYGSSASGGYGSSASGGYGSSAHGSSAGNFANVNAQ